MSVQIRQRLIFFFSTLFLQTMMIWCTGNVHEYWNHRIQNIWGQKNWGKVSISQRKIKKKTEFENKSRFFELNTGISKYFVHLIMSNVSARISQTFGHFPQWTQNLSEVAIEFFSTPSISRDIFLFFYIFNILWNWLILSKCDYQDGFDSIVFFAKNHAR